MGDFEENTVGVIDVFDQSGSSVSEVYQYDNPLEDAYNGNVTPALSNTTQIFLVNTSDGLALFVLHDAPDTDGGRAQMRFELSGDEALRLLEDDLGDRMLRPGNLSGPNLFQTHHWWIPNFVAGTTDGVVIGSLEGLWSLIVGFTDVDDDPGNEIVGLTSWVATSAVGTPFPLALEVDRRVQFEPIEEVGPEIMINIRPGTDFHPLNCNHARGVIKVVISSTADFDALAVDHTTIDFEGAHEMHVNRSNGLARRHEKDVDRDGDMDLILHFRFGETRLTCESNEATLWGQLFDGTEIEVTSEINIVEGPRVIKIR